MRTVYRRAQYRAEPIGCCHSMVQHFYTTYSIPTGLCRIDPLPDTQAFLSEYRLQKYCDDSSCYQFVPTRKEAKFLDHNCPDDGLHWQLSSKNGSYRQNCSAPLPIPRHRKQETVQHRRHAHHNRTPTEEFVPSVPGSGRRTIEMTAWHSDSQPAHCHICRGSDNRKLPGDNFRPMRNRF